LVVAQKLFAIPWKEVAIIVKKMNKKAAYRNTVSRFFLEAPFPFPQGGKALGTDLNENIALKGRHLTAQGNALCTGIKINNRPREITFKAKSSSRTECQ
jgi:hypothetical protein